MNKGKIYPWVFAVVFGVVGCVLVFFPWQYNLSDPWGGIISINSLFFYSSFGFFTGLVSGKCVDTKTKEDKWIFINMIFGGFVGIIGIYLYFYVLPVIPDETGPWIVNLSTLLLICLCLGLLMSCESYPDFGYPALGIAVILLLLLPVNWIGAFVYMFYQILIEESVILVLIILTIIQFGPIGYVIGVPIAEKAEQRAEIKRREELERERIRREEERRRLEYVQKIREYKSKVEQWEREGYDVSKLRERWFK